MRLGHAHEQDLLLLIHGALPLPQRALTEAHLRRCPQCRHRRQQLLGLSQALAGAVRDPSDPPWRAPVSARLTPLVVTLSLLVILGIALITGIRHAHHAPPVSPYSGGCRPDLPNDRCR